SVATPPKLQPEAERPARWPGDKTSWSFRPTGLPVCIRGAGCSNSYGVIGAPGTGKSHLVRNTLRSMIDYAPDCQDAVKFLAHCEAHGITLENCPLHIRTWIDKVKDRPRRRQT